MTAIEIPIVDTLSTDIDACALATDCRFLDGLPEEDRDRLLAFGHLRRFRPHAVLFREGDEALDVMIVRRGEVKLSSTLFDREVVLDVTGPGSLLGELSAIDGLPRSATAVALEAAEIVCIPTADFRAFILGSPSAALQLLGALSDRLRSASRRQAEYGALDAVGRVCRRLLEMMDRYGDSCGDGNSIRINGPLTQSDIAAWAGLSRESVVKALHSLRRLGWVTTTPKAITVLNPGAVATRAAMAPV